MAEGARRVILLVVQVSKVEVRQCILWVDVESLLILFFSSGPSMAMKEHRAQIDDRSGRTRIQFGCLLVGLDDSLVRGAGLFELKAPLEPVVRLDLLSELLGDFLAVLAGLGRQLKKFADFLFRKVEDQLARNGFKPLLANLNSDSAAILINLDVIVLLWNLFQPPDESVLRLLDQFGRCFFGAQLRDPLQEEQI